MIARTLCTILLLTVGTAVAAKKSTCAVDEAGTMVTSSAVTRLGGTPPVFVSETQRFDRAAGTQTSSKVVRRGKRVVFEAETTVTGGAVTSVVQRFGKGFKGIAEIAIRRGAAGLELIVDGRRTIVTEGSPRTVAFEDGQEPPTLRAKRDVIRLLRKIEQRPRPSCPASAAIAPQAELNPFEAECGACTNACGAEAFACSSVDVVLCAVAPAGCAAIFILDFFSNSLDCVEAAENCVTACYAPSAPCCRKFCGTSCCNDPLGRTDFVCAGATPTSFGTCCFSDALCGDECCPAGSICADDARGLCCPIGQRACGDACCPLDAQCDPARSMCCGGEPCGAFCCLPGEQCASPSEIDPDLVVCVACTGENTGPVCGDTCCKAGEVCGAGDVCCSAGNLCGGTCCAPENCMNGTTCCALPTGVPCGDNCCPSLTTTCCNGQCCPGACLGGAVCCPSNRVCGNTCCPTGFTCTNPAAGTCEACPGGQEPCPFDPGSPLCCPAGTQCCGNGQCCGAPTFECCDRPFDQGGPFCSLTCVD